MNTIFILFHAGRGDLVSFDSELRLQAGALILKNLKVAEVFFIGGGGLSPSGAERMQIYWKKNLLVNGVMGNLGNQSNTTVTNIKEIKSKLDSEENDSSVVITSLYHVSRVQKIINFLGLNKITVMAAENLLLESEEISQEEKIRIKEYIDSPDYQRKLRKENFLKSLFFLDRIFQLFRRIVYKKN